MLITQQRQARVSIDAQRTGPHDTNEIVIFWCSHEMILIKTNWQYATTVRVPHLVFYVFEVNRMPQNGKSQKKAFVKRLIWCLPMHAIETIADLLTSHENHFERNYFNWKCSYLCTYFTPKVCISIVTSHLLFAVSFINTSVSLRWTISNFLSHD